MNEAVMGRIRISDLEGPIYSIIMFFLLLLAIQMADRSISCLQSVPSDTANGCSSCLRNLTLATCPYQSSCLACSETTINYRRNADTGCRTAFVICPETVSTQYVRLNRADGGFPIETPYAAFGAIRCTSNGWQFRQTNGSLAIVTGATCFTLPGSTQQSPINIMASQVVFDPTLLASALNFTYVVGDAAFMTVDAAYHGFTLTMPDTAQSRLSSSNLDGSYVLRNLHGHWGDATTNLGSEHLLFGIRKAAELHFVHWNPKYGSFSNSVGKPDGIAVMAVFVEVGVANTEFQKIIDAINGVLPIAAGGEVEVEKPELNNVDY